MNTVPVDAGLFRESLSRWPSGVTIVTTVDAEGRPWGFTASAFTSLSGAPPLILVCLDERADCHPSFMATQRFAVNVLAHDQEDIAVRFATKGADKFAGLPVVTGSEGLPLIEGASMVLQCAAHERLPQGDHVILIGAVLSAEIREAQPLVYYRRTFHRLPAACAAE
ncbi:hypothetical protein PZ61_0235765 [Streptomyces sp. MNU77]|uniref:flavin reductase family protein n=1 Tax=Streptomyces sp. MNU77 TaxID=1573406 RepID=UPI0005EA2B30|nr:flavin reductase family protein [Streptomyces sp. MNU77]OLO25794.1 hypothetical protein PZ61_0235765 [Streptomyces sp. MNU77]